MTTSEQPYSQYLMENNRAAFAHTAAWYLYEIQNQKAQDSYYGKHKGHR